MSTTKHMEKGDEEDTRTPPPPVNSPWSVYLRPQYLTVLISRNKLIYGFSITLWYLVQFIGAVATINLYSDVERKNPCDIQGDLSDPDESSKVFDVPLLLLAIYHMVEWIRMAIMLTVVCIGVNLSIFWYLLIPNTVYGLVAYLIVHIGYFGEDGQLCKETQGDRAVWLLIEIIAFWCLFFVFAFPFLCTICLGKDRADTTLLNNYNEQDEEQDENEPEADESKMSSRQAVSSRVVPHITIDHPENNQNTINSHQEIEDDDGKKLNQNAAADQDRNLAVSTAHMLQQANDASSSRSLITNQNNKTQTIQPESDADPNQNFTADAHADIVDKELQEINAREKASEQATLDIVEKEAGIQ